MKNYRRDQKVKTRSHSTNLVRVLGVAISLFSVSSAGLLLIYRANLRRTETKLQRIVANKAQLIELMIERNALATPINIDDPATAEILQQILNAGVRINQRQAFTPELFVLQQRGTDILQLNASNSLVTSDSDSLTTQTIFPFGEDRFREQQTLTHIDAQGQTLLLVPQAIAMTNLDIVAQVDLASLRKPFWQYGFFGAIASLIISTGSIYLVNRFQQMLQLARGNKQALKQEILERQQIEVTLEKTEQKFKAIFDSTFQFIGLLDIDGRILEANRTALDAIAITREDVLGHYFWQSPWWDHSPQLQTQLQEGIQRAATGELVRFEAEHILANGESVFVDFSLKPVPDGTGKIVMLIPEGRDISDRHYVELELRETLRSLKLQKDALDQAAIVAITDPQGVITYVNDQFCQISQYSRDELIGKTHAVINSGYHPHEFFTELWSTISAGQVWKGEIRNQAKNGQNYWVDTTIVPFLDADQKPYQYLAIRFDITESKNAEATISEQAALLNVATDAIFVRDLNHRIQFWNRGAEKIYGWSAAEVTGVSLYELLYANASPTLRHQVKAAMRTVLLEDEWQGELTKINKHGKSLTIASRWTLVRDEQQKPKAILSVDTDITERRLLEQQFLRTQRLENLGTLASGIAHDLNNIFTPIIAASELLPRSLGDIDPRSQRLLDLLESSGRRGSHLIKQILSFARGLDGEQHMTQVGHILREVANIVRQTFPKNIDTIIDIPTRELWTVKADPTQMQQVFMNLAVNARDAMPTGGTLTLEAKNIYLDPSAAEKNIEAQPGVYLVVTVQDTGSGIAHDVMEHIFDPFFSTKPTGKGTGLGLSTVFGIVKNHNGFLKVNSEIGQGSTFDVYLPAVNFSVIADDSSRESLPKKLLGNNEWVLVIDDEASVREILKLTLEAFNYRVLTATDSLEALDIYRRRSPEIQYVLSDLEMPSLESSTFIKTIRQQNPKVKLILMSGSDHGKSFSEQTNSDFLAKPFTTETLLKILKR